MIHTAPSKGRLSLLALGIVGFVAVAGLFIYVLEHVEFMTAGPDSIRFMQIFQKGADQFQADGGGVLNLARTVITCVRDAALYDANRARVFQYLFYGVDGLTRCLLPSSILNVWMYIILIINSFISVWIATSTVINRLDRGYCLCFGSLLLLTHSISFGAVIVANLYAKYIWLTFILLVFVVKSRTFKCICLICAAFSDEIGLFAAMIMVFIHGLRFILEVEKLKHGIVKPWGLLMKAAFLSGVASIAVLLSYYGVISIVLNPKFNSFRIFAYGNANDIMAAGKWLSNAMQGIFWRGEVLVLGVSTGLKSVAFLVGVAVAAVVFGGVWLAGNRLLAQSSVAKNDVGSYVLAWLNERRCFFYTFWGGLFLFVSFVVLPRSFDYGHYGYPAIAILAVLMSAGVADIIPPRILRVVLPMLLLVHLAFLSRSVREAETALHGYLFPDGTVSSAEMVLMNKSIEELRARGRDDLFRAINNQEEINFDGTWYYSKKTSYGDSQKPYFPVLGTVRVYIWPMVLPTSSGEH